MRWTLAEIRRTLTAGSQVVGDPVTVTFAEGVAVEVDATDLSEMGESVAISTTCELPGGPASTVRGLNETWLLVERSAARRQW